MLEGTVRMKTSEDLTKYLNWQRVQEVAAI